MAAPDTTASSERLIPADHYFIFPAEKGEALIRAVAYVPPERISGYWTPSTEEVTAMDAQLMAFLATLDRVPRADWTPLRCQAVGVMRGTRPFIFGSYFVPPVTAGERSQFAPEDPRINPAAWRTEPFWVNDGGEDYFRVLYDPPHRQFIWYEQNNPAPWGP